MVSPLTSLAVSVLEKQFSVRDVTVDWNHPRELDHGDLATNVALQLAKKVGKSPMDIAQILAEGLMKDASVEKAEAIKPGYVNVWLTTEALIDSLTHTEASTKALKAKAKAKPVIVEYSQPNIAKPLGIHHLIGTAIGQATANLYRHAGYKVIAWNYIGDWGTQFGKLAVAYGKWGKKPVLKHSIDELLELYVRFHDEAEKDATLEDQGREAFRKMEQGDTDLRAFWTDVVTVTKKSLEGVYKRLHVSFDLDLGESFYEDKMEMVIAEGKQKHVFTAGEGGSLIVQFPEAKNMPPYLIVKGDGATLYSTRDLAQMRYRLDEYAPAEILIFTDIAQKLHFEQLVETCRMLGWELPAFENVLFGRMRFADKSMSTRKGNILNLEQVLDEAVKRADAIIKERGDSIQTDDPADLAEMMGVGSLVYSIVSQNRKLDLVFDWDKMLSFEGNSAPYIQYTHARAKSVLRKAGESTALTRSLPAGERSKGRGSVTSVSQRQAKTLLSRGERLLLRTLQLYPKVLEDARATHMPHKLANFLYQLCQDFNAFYNSDDIVKAEEPSRSLRLQLTDLTARVLQSGAGLLTLRLPERM